MRSSVVCQLVRFIVSAILDLVDGQSIGISKKMIQKMELLYIIPWFGTIKINRNELKT